MHPQIWLIIWLNILVYLQNTATYLDDYLAKYPSIFAKHIYIHIWPIIWLNILVYLQNTATYLADYLAQYSSLFAKSIYIFGRLFG
jgi:hypothetical protein